MNPVNVWQDFLEELFETIWQDRAVHAGWNLQIKYNSEDCIFSFTKASFNL